MKDFVNPYNFTADQLPMAVFVDNANNFISWAIKWHTNGIYNHSMNMVNLGEFVSQDPTGLNRVPLDKYVRKGCKLKFWAINAADDVKLKIVKKITEDAEKPWYKNMYDILGILGQFLKIKKLNNPWKYFCSERVAKYLRILDPDVPVHASPEELNEYMKTKPLLYSVVGYWIAD